MGEILRGPLGAILEKSVYCLKESLEILRIGPDLGRGKEGGDWKLIQEVFW